MIGIEEIGTYIPEQRINNIKRIKQFDVDESFLTEKIGMLQLALKDKEEETSDLCVKAFYDLKNKTGVNTDDIDCILVCTQNPDKNGLPHTSAVVHGKLGISDNCAAFDISLGCSGYVYSLSVIQAFMQANNLRKGVLFTADPYSKVIDDRDKNTSLLFGDAATATLISSDPKWVTGKFLFGTHGQDSNAIKIDESNNKLSMNGRAVFSFSATMVPNHILKMLEENQLKIEDVDLFALHQGSRFIVDTIRKKLGVDVDRLPFVASSYGNTVSSSIPLLLSSLSHEPKQLVTAGFGVGLSWASTVLFNVKMGK